MNRRAQWRMNESILSHRHTLRRSPGPSFLVAKTFRPREFLMSDPMKYRTREEWREGPEREPIKVYSRRLMERGWIDEFALEQLGDEAHALAADAVKFADQSPDPLLESRFEHVLSGRR